MATSDEAKNDEHKIGGLAFRMKDKVFTAYYMLPNEEPIFIASLTAAAVRNPKHRQAFIELVQTIVSDVIKDATGIAPTWGEPKDFLQA